MKCEMCPRKCGVDRKNSIGVCGCGESIKLAKAVPLNWEEPIISGTKGSGAIFFSGCNLKCCFCQNYQISHENFGKAVSLERFVEIIKELEHEGVHNINLVSPTQFSDQIICALSKYKPKVPVIWNSNGYENVATIRKLRGLVDVFLVDMKFASNELSKSFCLASDYVERNREAVSEMLAQQPKVKVTNDLITKGVIIRHLIMPNCVKDSLEVLEYLAKFKVNFDFLLSIMCQYVPCYKAKTNPIINRTITPLEQKIVISRADKLGLTGFSQDLSSADTCFIPKFDLEGI